MKSYETSNGIAADQTGYLKNRGTNLEAQVITFAYIKHNLNLSIKFNQMEYRLFRDLTLILDPMAFYTQVS